MPSQLNISWSLLAPALFLTYAACGAKQMPATVAAPKGDVLTVIATAELRGTTEPCGCASDPLGDIARVARLAEDSHALWVDAGGLLYDEVASRGGAADQAVRKATCLEDIAGESKVELGLGSDDLWRGATAIKAARHADDVAKNIPLAAPSIRIISGVRVGIFGVVSAARAKALTVSDPGVAAEKSVAKLRSLGAQLVVGLLGMNRTESRALLSSVRGIDIGVVGAEVEEGMPEAEPVGDGILVSPADQGRRVARLDFHIVDGKVALRPFAGQAARQRELERVDKKRLALTMQLEAWRADPSADAAFVAARRQELGELEAERARLKGAVPAPPTDSYFTYALVPVRRDLPRSTKVAARLSALDGEIGRANLAAAQHEPAIPTVAGQPHYVGMSTCARCHKQAAKLWKTTVHAQAWKTLVDVNKQYNYDCTGCHVTGWLRPGGSQLATAEKVGLTSIQCETCHGPGSKHVEESGLDEPRTIHRRPDDGICAGQCHTKEHSDTFDLAPYLRDVLGQGHGEKLRAELGPGITAHELRKKAMASH